MNKQRVRAVLDHLTPENHDQVNFISMCNTKFCVAGHAILMFGEEEEKRILLDGMFADRAWDVGQRILELDSDQASEMFRMSATLEEQEACYEAG